MTDHELRSEGTPVGSASTIAEWSEPAVGPRVGFWKAYKEAPASVWPYGTLAAVILLLLSIKFHFLLNTAPAWLLSLVCFDLNRLSYWRSRQAVPIDSVPDVGAQFPVRIHLKHEGSTYGGDAGVLSIAEGGLHFKGLQTEFSLTHRNAKLRPLGKDFPYQFTVDFQAGVFDGFMTVIPCRPDSGSKPDAEGIRAALSEWEQAPESVAWTETIDPPITVQPGLVKDELAPTRIARNVCTGIALVMFIGLMWAGAFHTLHGPDYLAGVFLCGVLVWIGESGRRKSFRQASILLSSTSSKANPTRSLELPPSDGRNASWKDGPVRSSFTSVFDQAKRMLPEGHDDLEDLYDVPSPSAQFPVFVSLSYQDVPYGVDKGVLTILDGGLHFQGLRTDFSLAHQNTRLILEMPSDRDPTARVVLECQSALPVSIVFVPLFGKRTPTWEFYWAIRQWDEGAGSMVWESPMDPPIVPQPEIVRSLRMDTAAWRAATYGCGVLAMAVLVAAGIFVRDFSWVSVVLMVEALLGFGTYALWFKYREIEHNVQVLEGMEER